MCQTAEITINKSLIQALLGTFLLVQQVFTCTCTLPPYHMYPQLTLVSFGFKIIIHLPSPSNLLTLFFCLLTFTQGIRDNNILYMIYSNIISTDLYFIPSCSTLSPCPLGRNGSWKGGEVERRVNSRHSPPFWNL